MCELDVDTVGRFKDSFQFPKRVGICQPNGEDWACHFFLGEVCYYEAAFTYGLRLLIHPFVMVLLSHFGIAPG